jgi:cytochrome c1
LRLVSQDFRRARRQCQCRFANTPDNLVQWIRNPRAMDSQTAMPAVGVDEAQARDIAAYLYTR